MGDGRRKEGRNARTEEGYPEQRTDVSTIRGNFTMSKPAIKSKFLESPDPHTYIKSDIALNVFYRIGF